MAELYTIASPIGNLGDCTFRAVEVLKKCDLIIAEDTRHSQKLLKHYEISGKKITSVHARTSEEKIKKLCQEISQENLTGFPAIDWSVSCENSSLNSANASNGDTLLSKVIGGTFSQENFTTAEKGKSTSITGIDDSSKEFIYGEFYVKDFINNGENTNCWLSLKNTGVKLISLVYKASASEKITAPETLIKSTGQPGNAKKVIKFNKPQKALIDWF